MKSFVYETIRPAKSNTIISNGSGKSMPSVAIQKKGNPEEEPVQGKFIIQKQSGAEEEHLQKKAIQLAAAEEELPVQKKDAEEEPLQMKPFQLAVAEEELPVQKKDAEEEPLQMKTTQLAAPEEELPVQKKANNTGLPDNLKSGVETLSGYSMDDVKVHYGSAKPAQLNALAYAQGTDIHVAPGQEKHLPHEAWHVAQQKQGRVQPTMQMKQGVAVNDDPGLENEADVMGAKAVQMKRGNNAPPALSHVNNTSPAITVQRRKYSDKEVSSLIKWGAKNADPNVTAILLVIYNQMRIESHPPVEPAAFTSIPNGVKALVKAGKIDDDDAAVLKTQATLIQQSAGDPAELVKLRAIEKINAKYDAVDGKYGHHIFKGDFSGVTPTGFHSKIDGSDTHEAYGAVTNLPNKGAYQQSVRSSAIPANRKTNQSTFFPNAATHEQIIKGIASVYELGSKTVSYVDPIINGMELTKRGDTIYPAGGSDTLLAAD